MDLIHKLHGAPGDPRRPVSAAAAIENERYPSGKFRCTYPESMPVRPMQI